MIDVPAVPLKLCGYCLHHSASSNKLFTFTQHHGSTYWGLRFQHSGSEGICKAVRCRLTPTDGSLKAGTGSHLTSSSPVFWIIALFPRFVKGFLKIFSEQETGREYTLQITEAAYFFAVFVNDGSTQNSLSGQPSQSGFRARQVSRPKSTV